MTGLRSMISVRVHAAAPRNELIDCRDGVWHIKVAAPPVRGKANAELVDYLSGILDLGKSSLEIIKGHTGHTKLIEITGLGHDEVVRRLSRRVSSGGASTR